MPTLQWIGKDKVVTHHNDVPYRVLERKYTFGDTPNSGNMIIHGDNLEALKALLPEYENRIKCIYIDPPYNTGNEGWIYNDNVNDPHIKKWLKDVFHEKGITTDDLTRHDKWLCMMYPRLVLLQHLLADDGAIFISIDDNEQANLKLICDEIFGARNFVAQFVWQKKTGAADPQGIATITEYILCYCGEIKAISSTFTKDFSAFDIKRYRYHDEYLSDRGPFYYDSLDRGSIRYSDSLNYEILSPDGNPIFPNGRTTFENDGWTWKWSKEKVQWGLRNGFISIEKNPKSKNGWSVKYKIYLNVDNEGNRIEKSVPFKNLITNILNADASARIKKIFQTKVFEYAKPVELIEFFIRCLCLEESSIVLDSYAGSGTTAHAVLNLNKQDGSNHKFILVEMMDYADTITAERVRRVMKGYGEGKDAEKGTGGSFDFYELGETIFDPVTGNLNDNADTEAIRRYLWFSETNSAYIKPGKDTHPYLLGSYQHNNYYFYYIKGEETCLAWDFLNTFTQKDKAEMYIIYADRCVLTEDEMQRLNIVFKKIPRDIKRV